MAAAQTADGPAMAEVAMRLDEALVNAEKYQTSLNVARARLGRALAASRVASARWLPTLSAGVEWLEGTANNTTASYAAIPGVDVPRVGATATVFQTDDASLSPYASSIVAVSARQQLLDFGRVAAERALLDADLDEAKARQDVERRAVALLVHETWLAIHAARSILDASDAAYKRSEVHAAWAQAGVKAGLQPANDLTRAQADLARFDVERVRAAGGLQASRAALAAAIGGPWRSVDVVGEPPPLAPLPPLAVAFQSAVQNSPETVAARAVERRREAEAKFVSAQSRPDVVAMGGASVRAGGAPATAGGVVDGKGWEPNIPNWQVGLMLRWPLYDPVQRAVQRVAESQTLEATAQLEDVRARQSAAISQAHMGVVEAQAALQAQMRAADAAKANHAQVEARFHAGLANAVELADAEELRTNAEIQTAVTRFDLARTRAVLSRLMGEEQ